MTDLAPSSCFREFTWGLGVIIIIIIIPCWWSQYRKPMQDAAIFIQDSPVVSGSSFLLFYERFCTSNRHWLGHKRCDEKMLNGGVIIKTKDLSNPLVTRYTFIIVHVSCCVICDVTLHYGIPRQAAIHKWSVDYRHNNKKMQTCVVLDQVNDS